MNGFLKMSNKIFSYNLSPKAFMVYSYLCVKANLLRSTTAKCEDIATHCNMCRQSVMTAIKELEDKLLVTKQNRYNSFGYKSSRFYVKNLVEKKGWFKIERQLFNTTIKPTDFMVYVFIKKCMFNHTAEAYPSINYIAKNTCISHRRVETAVKYLWQFTFLNKINRKRRNKTYKKNRYLHFKCIINKKRMARNKRTTKNKCFNSFTLILYPRNIKRNIHLFLPMVQFFNNTS